LRRLVHLSAIVAGVDQPVLKLVDVHIENIPEGDRPSREVKKRQRGPSKGL